MAVLCLIFTAGLLTTAVLAISKNVSFSVAAHLELQRSMYVAEGTANRVQWLIAADSTAFTSREIADVTYGDYEYDRYLADGVPHTIDYHGKKVSFSIYDAISGLDMDPSTYADTLSSLAQDPSENTEWQERLTTLQALIADYVDEDENVTEEGREAGDYEELGMEPLPRNAAPYFREEYLYIKEYREAIPLDPDGRMSRTRLIPPDGLADLSGAPSLYSADEEVLRSYCQLEDTEIREVQKALLRLRNRKEPISDNLSEELLEKISSLATTESNYYTVVIRAPEQSGTPFRRLVFSYTFYGLDGAEDQMVRYLEWMFF